MLYNDEETRKDEELFQEHLKKARSLTEEDLDKLKQHMEIISKTALQLKDKPSLTAEEADLFERIKKALKQTEENMRNMQLVLGESTRRQAYAWYLHVKKLAEEGNPEAMKVYEELKPGYQASLQSDLSDN